MSQKKTILAPIMAHAIWNIIGALILGGVSLADDYPSVLIMTASANKLLSGGAYKIEASIVVTILNIALMVIFYIQYRSTKKNRKYNKDRPRLLTTG
mgnify:CR=1 FL=1